MEIDQDNINNIKLNQKSERELLSTHNKLIEVKRLQFNYIWTNKITQEDLATPKALDNQKDNMILSKNIFNSIVKFSERTNELYLKILNNTSDNKDDYLDLLYVTSALIQKMKNFL